MKNSRLVKAFGNAPSTEPVHVVYEGVAPSDYERLSVSEADLNENGDIVIAAAHDSGYEWDVTEPTMKAGEFRDCIAYAPEGSARVVIRDWHGDKYAVFTVKKVEYTSAGYNLILGKWLCGKAYN